MQELCVAEYELMNFAFVDELHLLEHFHQNPEIFFMLEGEGTLTLGEYSYHLKKDDYILLNPNVRHSFQGEFGAFYASVQINYTLASRWVDLQHKVFICNSTTDDNEGVTLCRRLIRQILNQYYSKDTGTNLKLVSLYYSLLDRLSQYFLVDKRDVRAENSYFEESQRISEICSFIYANYKYPISLNDLAQQIYLSTAYLSKYIKKTLGMNFKEYLTSVRLERAVNAMRRGEEQNLTRIALEHGFPNVTAFTKAFRDAYGMTAGAWLEEQRKTCATPENGEYSQTIGRKIKQYLGNAALVEQSEELNIHYTTVNNMVGPPLKKSWNRMINLGLVSELLQHDVQQQVLMLSKELKFTHVRIWDMYAPELHLNIGASATPRYNFSKLERAFDFLIDHGIKPYIELGFKPIRILNSANQYIVREERPCCFETTVEFRDYLQAFISHFLNRYGIEQVQDWYFELWDDRRKGSERGGISYFDYFEAAYQALKSVVPQIRVGGAGFEQLDTKADLQRRLAEWKERPYQPDFVSIYCYPYYPESRQQELGKVRIMDPDYTREHISGYRKAWEESKLNCSEFHVSEWGSSVANRNSMNDSCNTGAFIVKNLIDCIGCADLMGYWVGTDLYSEFGDANLPLFGGVGLLTKDGIRKPAYYAFYFMNQLGSTLLARNEYSIITTNGHDDFEIVCHNFKNPNQKYFLNPENRFGYSEFDMLYYDVSSEKLCFRLTGVRNGRYQIKIRLINCENGSVQDEWRKIDQLISIRRQDIQYLKDICVPRNYVDTQLVTNGELKIDAYLQPHEIRYIHVTYQPSVRP